TLQRSPVVDRIDHLIALGRIASGKSCGETARAASRAPQSSPCFGEPHAGVMRESAKHAPGLVVPRRYAPTAAHAAADFAQWHMLRVRQTRIEQTVWNKPQ